jgi:hypothetical protein
MPTCSNIAVGPSQTRATMLRGENEPFLETMEKAETGRPTTWTAARACCEGVVKCEARRLYEKRLFHYIHDRNRLWN